jgi:excinuclease ABC A subunit
VINRGIMKEITIKGARIHNLKNIDIAIPKNKLIVATGVSGSGKSSLVFDIVFKEGRRQYLQSLGILSDFNDENNFDYISGIGPTIAVEQSIIRQSNPRSTIGTRTNILAMLGLIYAQDGIINCYYCNSPVDENMKCKKCDNVEEKLQANYFSYNDPNGMCIKCSGKGKYFEINMENLVKDENTTLEEVYDISGVTHGYKKLLYKKFKDYFNTKFLDLPDEITQEVLYGHYTTGNSENRSYCLSRLFKNRLQKDGDDLDGIYSTVECSDCNGFRIGEEARLVLLNNKHIGELGKMTISELHDFLKDFLYSVNISTFGEKLLKEILIKTENLIKYRLGHLTLYREMPSLSGGEIQRLFLNSHLESKMDSLIYILDEPTSGLHESEKTDLLNSIKELKNIGNTVIVVEHDKTVINMAEHIIDIGPKAGIEGGELIYQGDLKGLYECEESVTGRYLSGFGIGKPLVDFGMGKPQPYISVSIMEVNKNNLKNISVSFPLNCLVGIAGVSGSGKTSLISETLVPQLRDYFRNKKANKKLIGAENLSGYAEVSQAPIGRNMNSNPATYVGIWDKIRNIFAKQDLAIKQNLSAGHFSFNSKGACSVCGGSGKETIWLGGNLNTEFTCKECKGKRYNEEALSVKYKDKNIYDILNISIKEAIEFFSSHKSIISVLKVMDKIGMGYIKLGQPTPTFSGGEAQRVKLAKEIGKKRKGNILYVLDEPTNGLSLFDIEKLIELIYELIKKGNSVIVIEHDITVLNYCNWIIELGPKGGDKGGFLIAQGSPSDLRADKNSITGRYL